MNEHDVNEVALEELESSESGRPLLDKKADLINHVEVEVEVVVGQTSISIERLFNLSSGSVISLDQLVNEPVTLRVDNKDVALGKLVAEGDNIGIEVTERLF
jgi:flagellar motor switch protein FliN